MTRRLATDNSYKLTLEATPDANDLNFVRERLNEFNRLHVEDDNHKPLTVFLRDRQGTIVAGLVGATYWGWLHVELLWVEKELRRQGYGRKLLAAAEQEAIARGCQYAHLDTMSFQARGFYENQGYGVFGELNDLPAGHSRYFMMKELQPKPNQH